MVRRYFVGSFLAIWFAFIVPAEIASQPQRESGQGAVSSNVMSWWLAHREDTSTSVLDLLILWRGSPGWIFRGRSITGSGSSRQGFGSNTITETMLVGDRSLTWTLDVVAKSITILNQSFSLTDVNVLLIDGGDSTQGSELVRALQIDPRYLAEPMHFEVAVRRSPELLQFMQCDAQLDTQREQLIADLICARFAGR